MDHPTVILRAAGQDIQTTLDGYRVTRVEHEDGWVEWRVYTPDGTKPRAVCAYEHETLGVIAALRATDNECPNAHLVWPDRVAA